MKTAAIVLAAGASRRMGEPKQLVRFGNETLLERAVAVCTAAGCSPVIAVLGAFSATITSQIRIEASVLINPDWEEGIASSIRAGVRSLADDVDGCILLTCDMPYITDDHLRLLLASGRLMSSAYAGRRGVPAYFPRSSFSSLLQLQGDHGARDLLLPAEAIDLPAGEFDIDTPEDLKQLRLRSISSANRR